jgi:F-type H+-transporting ATPase subunit b
MTPFVPRSVMRKVTTWMACAMLLLAGSLALANPPAGGGHAEATPAVKAAAEGHGEKSPVKEELNLGTFAVTILIFLTLFLILTRTAWKPIMTGLQNREQAIRDSVEAAKNAREAADQSAKDLEAKMVEVQRQAALQLQQARADAQKIAEAMRAQAEADSAAIKDRTLRDINAAKQQALAEINTHAAQLATAVARKILQRNITVEDQQRLVDESLADLAKKN